MTHGAQIVRSPQPISGPSRTKCGMATVETAAEHERILREIESTDTNCIGPTLRSVYDGQEHGVFMDKLDVRIRNHDREIEKMCNHHFQGFVDSITELLKVRGEAQKLKSQVTETNRSLQGDGKELMNSMEELRQCRVQQRNIATTVDKLTHCLPVLEMYARLQEQMETKRYYPALCTLEQLEQTCLPRAGQYRFCTIMAENIPKLRTQIRDTAMIQLKDFLESIRKHSDKIGETAIRQAQLQRSLDNSISPVGRRPRREALAAARVMQSNGEGEGPLSELDSGILDVEDEEDDDDVSGAQDLVDFSPVYRCLHIYTVLGLRDVFENYYRKQRRKQARLVLQPHSNMHETLEGYRRYFNQIVGFFVVEDHVLHTTQGLVNRAYVEELWELALSKIVAALRTHSSYCDDPDLVLDLKNLIVLFADTLQGYGFPVSQLFDMLLEIREQYGEILMKRWNITFRQVLDQDNFSPIPVSTEEEYRHYTSLFPLQDPQLDKLPFPKKLPFSQFVPKVYCQLKEFIYACLKYSEDLHLSSTEVDDMIRKSTNLLLTRTLSHCLQYAIKKKNVGLAELVQVIINTTHLEQSCHFLEEFIANITNVPPDTANATKLYGTSTFKDARHAAEAEIYTSLNAKIDQFLQLADYDWLVGVPTGDAPMPSDYLLDLVAFLKSTFSVFTNLPGKVAQTACMSACKHISTSLMQLLLDPEVKQISMGALHQLNADVHECEGFARAGPVAGFQGDTLLLAFSDLRQLLELFTMWDWSSYLADYGKASCKYLRVNPHAALALLEKMRESSRMNVVFAQFRKTDRDRQKLIDTIIKQLRNVIAQQQHT
ncbi:exocyst complex component 6B isoform X2 [Nerophis lumbriciformis]|uniref:exocyst complex component 6B isoform X2 n=1 Tax=Nerophis lumbriciformis TaxID=546530 RepID=UPI002AE00E30|nr:exocyst complex component 6B-like isoform X2 [Nerophis lumbriciformis]